jgi:hypothetical protein
MCLEIEVFRVLRDFWVFRDLASILINRLRGTEAAVQETCAFAFACLFVELF